MTASTATLEPQVETTAQNLRAAINAIQPLQFALRTIRQSIPELDLDMAFPHCTNASHHLRLVPREPLGYYPPIRQCRKILVWVSNHSHKQGLLLKGETGTGKTELVLWLASRIGWPVARLECNAHMTPEVIDGGTTLVASPDGSGIITRRELADVLKVYRDGGFILLDEVDKISDEVAERLHAIIDGKPVTVPDTGEVIYKHPLCKVIGTANTVGDGTSMRYVTSRKWDEAFRARWACVEIPYLTPAEELLMLQRRYHGKQLSDEFLTVMVRLANTCRDAALGVNRDGDQKNLMGSIFSTRILVNVLDTAMMFGGNTAFVDSINFSWREMLTKADRQRFDSLFQLITAIDLKSSEMTFLAFIKKSAQWVNTAA